MADESGLELGQVSYKNDREKDRELLRYTLTFTVAGAYRDIKQFVHALEQSPGCSSCGRSVCRVSGGNQEPMCVYS